MTSALTNDRIMAIQVGLDLVSVESVAEALRGSHGDRYLARVYTQHEIADCRTPAGIDPQRLAARFAAKEATLKVLSATEASVSFHDIEVRREPSGRHRLALYGRAAELAAAAGLVGLAVSLTQERGFAMAWVVADRMSPAR